MKLRLLPATIVAAVALLAIKVGDTVRSAERVISGAVAAEGPATVPITEAKTEEKKPEAPAAPTPPAKPAEPAKPEAPKPAEGEVKPEAKPEAKTEEKKPEEKPAEAAKPAEPAKAEHGEEKKAEGEAGHGEAPKVALPESKTEELPPEEKKIGGLRPEDKRFSPEEVQIFQMLAKRREDLEEWKSDMSTKEVMLVAVEKRLDQKLVEMDGLKKELGALLAQYNEKEDAKVASLVKIYESMKPKDAARIFDEIEMPILLMVIDKMAEKKAAPILAAMDPKKAKQLTVELAEKRKLERSRLSAATAAQPFKPPATPSAPPANP